MASEQSAVVNGAIRAGWETKRSAGSRVILTHPLAPGKMVVTSQTGAVHGRGGRNAQAQLRRALRDAAPERTELDFTREVERREKAERKIEEMKQDIHYMRTGSEELGRENRQLQADLLAAQAEIAELKQQATAILAPLPPPPAKKPRAPYGSKTKTPAADKPYKWWKPAGER